MNKFNLIKKLLLFSLTFILNCENSPKNVLGPRDLACRLWWLYDKRPTPTFICYNQKKYNTYTVARNGKLRKPLPSDVIDLLTEHGKWEIKGDTLFLQGTFYSKIKNTLDTIYLQHNVFLLDQTGKFNISNCNCDSLIAQFKGGKIDSITTLLNYKE